MSHLVEFPLPSIFCVVTAKQIEVITRGLHFEYGSRYTLFTYQIGISLFDEKLFIFKDS